MFFLFFFIFSTFTLKSASEEIDPFVVDLLFEAVCHDDSAFIVTSAFQQGYDLDSDPDSDFEVLHCINLISQALLSYDVETHLKELKKREPHINPEFIKTIEPILFLKDILHKNPAYANALDRYGRTLLEIAISQYRNYTTKLLIETPGININYQKRVGGKTALHTAVQYSNSYAVELLCQNSATPNSEAAYGFTPLHSAAMKDDLDLHLHIVDILLKYGADKTKKWDGETPYEMAKKDKWKTKLAEKLR